MSFVSLTSPSRSYCSQLSDHSLSCGLCKNVLEEAKVLPCLHTFCLPCLKGRFPKKLNNLVSCPKCQYPVTEYEMVENEENINTNLSSGVISVFAPCLCQPCPEKSDFPQQNHQHSTLLKSQQLLRILRLIPSIFLRPSGISLRASIYLHEAQDTI